MKTETQYSFDKPELKVRVVRDRWLNGKPLNTWTAHLGNTGITAQGTCKTGALEQLHADLKTQEEHRTTRRYIRKGSVTFALYYAAGWQYDIVRDDGTCSTSMMLCHSYRDALSRMVAHVEQHDGV